MLLNFFAKFREKQVRYQDIFGNTVFKKEFGAEAQKHIMVIFEELF